MFDCVLPAAGASSRMRSSDGNDSFKPLLPFAGSTLVETAVGAALEADCRVLVVVGHRGDEIVAAFGAARYRSLRDAGRIVLVANPRWEEGLLGSIRAAFPFLRSDAFFVAHADMPFIEAETYRALAEARADRINLARADQVDAARAPGDEAAIFAAHEGRRGHPVLIPSAWIPEMQALDRSDRLSRFLQAKPAILIEAGSSAMEDVDRPGDYLAALAREKERHGRPGA
jgi:molybdenum cofactor cytidylyltransferase